MSDLFHRMMDVSDPIVVGMSPKPKTIPEKDLPPDMAELLLTSDQEEETADCNVSICNDIGMTSDIE